MKVIWELKNNEQNEIECTDLTEALDKLNFWAREYEDQLNWIEIIWNDL